MLIDKAEVEQQKKMGTSLAGFIDALHLDYMEGQERSHLGAHVKTFLRPKTWIRMGSAAALMGGAFLVKLAVLGPFTSATNAFTEPIMNPINQTLLQLGANLLADPARIVADALIDPTQIDDEEERLEHIQYGIEEMEKLLSEMNNMTDERIATDMRPMPDELIEQEKINLQKGLYSIYQHYLQYLPGHLNESRRLGLDAVLQQMVATQGTLAAVDLRREWYQEKLDALSEREKTHPLTPAEWDERRLYQGYVDASYEQIAATVVSYDFFKITHKDLFTFTEKEKVRAPMLNMHDMVDRHMRFDIYSKQVKNQADAMLSNMKLIASQMEFEIQAAKEKSKVAR